MGLFPGAPDKVKVGDHFEYRLDDVAIAGSMTLEIEKQLGDLNQKIKGSDLPDTGREDLRLLLMAISRGILSYLQNHQTDFVKTATTNAICPPVVHSASLELGVDMSDHVGEP